jgi:uncharacterized protein YcbK (DUF882 family)
MMECDRRGLLKTGLQAGLALAGGLLLPSLSLAAQDRRKDADARSLRFIQTHTGARGNFTYWEKGEYVPEALKEISHLLRDFRTGEAHAIDTSLLDQLYLLQYFTESSQPFQVISGYRSKKTNEMLRRQTKGVDKNSYHMQGRAIDVRLGDVRLHHLHRAALTLKAGGVGYYPDSNFIHVDSGVVRHWEFEG